jgi:hypothetical protein
MGLTADDPNRTKSADGSYVIRHKYMLSANVNSVFRHQVGIEYPAASLEDFTIDSSLSHRRIGSLRLRSRFLHKEIKSSCAWMSSTGATRALLRSRRLRASPQKAQKSQKKLDRTLASICMLCMAL